MTPDTWQEQEASTTEEPKGLTWLRKHVCPQGVVVIPVVNQAWLDADLAPHSVKLHASKTDYLFLVDNEETQALVQKKQSTTADDLRKVVSYVVGAYEAVTASQVDRRGILSVWPQATVDCLALNYMAPRNSESYFIPVFGGDFMRHIVVHAKSTDGDFEVHAAHMRSNERKDQTLAIRYMRYWLTQTLQAATPGKWLKTAQYILT